jgi:hypothetical protein
MRYVCVVFVVECVYAFDVFRYDIKLHIT